MSVKVSSWAWHEASDSISGNDLVVLLALADIANDEGLCVFVKSKDEATQGALAKKSRVSRRTFQRCIEHLVELGVVEVVRGSQHVPNTYRVLIQGGQSDASTSFQGGQVDAPDDSRGVKSSTQMRQIERSDASTVARHRDVLRKDVKRVPTLIPDPFVVTDEMRAWAETEATFVNLERETAAFVDYFRGEGKKYKDWVATWRNWMRRSQSSAERFRRDEPAAVVELENYTQLRLQREEAEAKARWFAEHGITEAEYEANRDNPAWLAALESGRG